MAKTRTDRIADIVRDIEKTARGLGDQLRKRAGKAGIPADVDAAVQQLLKGLTSVTVQVEHAVRELRRYLEANARQAAAASKKKPAKKKTAKKKAAKKKTKKKVVKKAAAKKPAKKAAAKKKTAKKKPAKKKPAKKKTKKRA